MSNLDNITEKIRVDAQNQAQDIKKDNDLRITELEEKNERQIQELKEDIDSRTERTIESEKEKIISRGKLNARDEQLARKNDVLDRVFNRAKEELKKLSDEDYLNFVKSNLATLQLKGTEKLIPQTGKAGLVKGLGVDVSNDESVESGFALKDGKITTNYVFDDLVDFYRPEIEGEISSILFEGKE